MDDLQWNGDEAVDHVRRRAVQWITRACIAVVNRAKVLLSVPGTGQGRNSAGRYARVYGANPSAPGEPPHKQTGRLRASVTYEVDESELEGRVGTNVEYGKHLELGTSRGIEPRPWLRRALAESRGQIEQFLSQLNGD